MGMLDLGTLGFNHSRATDVSSQGQVVGSASTFANFPSFGGTAFLWDSSTMFNLNQLVAPGAGWTLLSAEGINERGQIVGYGRRGDQLRAYRLTVSEPRSLLLLAIGLLAVARALHRPGHRNDQRGAAPQRGTTRP
jgi:probable HAF family extracellular repeat protein